MLRSSIFFSVLILIRSSYMGSGTVDDIHIDTRKLSIFLPTGIFPGEDAYLCQALQLNADRAYFVVSFDVQASAGNLHHLLLFGCAGENSHANEEYWSCDGMKSHKDIKHKSFQRSREDVEENSAPCAQLQLLYAWTRNGPGLVLPPNSSMTIGGDSEIQFLVLQAHYKNSDESISRERNSDSPIQQGVILHYTLIPQARVVGLLLINTVGTIEPKSQTCWDAVSRIHEDVILHPIYFAVHTHALGTNVSGYRIRKDKWTLIGSKDPQEPQIPYPAELNMTIREGDKLAMRCEFQSDRTTATQAGDRNEDEMCNFYIMYWAERGSDISEKIFFSYPATLTAPKEFINRCPNK